MINHHFLTIPDSKSLKMGHYSVRSLIQRLGGVEVCAFGTSICLCGHIIKNWARVTKSSPNVTRLSFRHGDWFKQSFKLH